MSDTKYTAVTLGEKMGIPRDAAYGFIVFMKAKGWAVDAGNQPSPSGKGKPSKLFQFTADAPTNLWNLIHTI